ncbi:MAG: cob(I)yrinic acid a,c-diamide adenosyltransferase [Bacteroidales bacterium]
MVKHKKEKGYIHLYTGNGKGKTTAAIGLALRAVGAGNKVFIAQFVKGMNYSELSALKRFPEITVKQFGLDCFIVNKPSQKDIDAAVKGFNEIKKVIKKNATNVLVLDEICIALYYHLIDINDLISLINDKPQEMEIIMTGRYAPAELINIADLVTEMKEVKHYFKEGIIGRIGIEF